MNWSAKRNARKKRKRFMGRNRLRSCFRAAQKMLKLIFPWYREDKP